MCGHIISLVQSTQFKIQWNCSPCPNSWATLDIWQIEVFTCLVFRLKFAGSSPKNLVTCTDTSLGLCAAADLSPSTYSTSFNQQGSAGHWNFHLLRNEQSADENHFCQQKCHLLHSLFPTHIVHTSLIIVSFNWFPQKNSQIYFKKG